MTHQLLTIDQVAERLQCGRRYVYKLIREKGLPAIKLPDMTRVDPVQLSVWLAARSTQRDTDAQWQAYVANAKPLAEQEQAGTR